MEVKSALHDYKIEFYDDGKRLIDSLGDANTYWVIDKKVYNIYNDAMFRSVPTDRLTLIEAIETNKCLDTALRICEGMIELPGKRNATLISVGGGITQDITGFAANILYRGIHWIFIPTTLLAASDSCMGGKTSLNYKSYKNLLGTFYPPAKICIVPKMFSTLSERDYLSGLGEVIKFNIMAGLNRVNRISTDMNRLLEREPQLVEQYVRDSLEFKKRFVEADEFDKDERIKLNFAHTFGHAFETLSQYEIPHGTAVAMGMIVANRISYGRGWLNGSLVEIVEKLLCQIIDVDLSVMDADNEVLLRTIKKDKKQISDCITAVLMHQDMTLEIVHDVSEQEIFAAVKKMKEILCNEDEGFRLHS